MHPVILHFDQLPAVRCPCGQARRALADCPQVPFSLHRVEVSADAQTHYHLHQTETYYILQASAGAAIELDGQSHPVQAGSCLVIPPGTRHRAVGQMTLLNVVVPKFDPRDEMFD